MPRPRREMDRFAHRGLLSLLSYIAQGIAQPTMGWALRLSTNEEMPYSYIVEAFSHLRIPPST